MTQATALNFANDDISTNGRLLKPTNSYADFLLSEDNALPRESLMHMQSETDLRFSKQALDTSNYNILSQSEL